jgi:hypothetical protein
MYGNFNAPDQDVAAAKLRAQDVQRARQRHQPAKTGRVRLFLRRVLGRENRPTSPADGVRGEASQGRR